MITHTWLLTTRRMQTCYSRNNFRAAICGVSSCVASRRYFCMLSVLVSACAESTSTYGGCKAPISGIFVRLLCMPETSRIICSIRGGTCGPTHLLVWPAFGNIDDPEKMKLLGGCGDGSMLLGSCEYPVT